MSDGEDRTEETEETPETPDTEEAEEAASADEGFDEAAEAEEAEEAGSADEAAEEAVDADTVDEVAPEPAAPAAPEPDDESELHIRMAPHSEGLFETTEVDVSDVDDEIFEGVFASHRHRSKAALLALAAAFAFALIGVIAIMTDDDMKHDFECFVNGTVDECKTAEVAKTKAKWKDEDFKSQNMYGNVELTFFPGDTTVKIIQVQKHTSGDEWRTNEGLAKCPADDATVGGAKEAAPKPKAPGGDAPAEPTPEPVKGAVDAAKFKTGTHEREIPNKTANIDREKGQTIERLPLENLPIFETQKNEFGCVSDVLNYEYRLEFERPGYHPLKRKWLQDDWKRIGPGNMIIEWPGLDLEPKPETIKANFSKVMHQEHCLKVKDPELKTLGDSMKHENFEIMLLRNGFKTREKFMATFETLTKTAEHAEWWKAEQEKIKAQKCEE